MHTSEPHGEVNPGRRRFLDVGHNVPQEDPRRFAQAVIDAGNL